MILQITSNLMVHLIKTRNVLSRHFGIILFLIIVTWFYNVPPWRWSTHIPALGDALEALWCIEMWRNAVIKQDLSFINLSAMYPLGLHIASIAHFGVGFLALPVSIIMNSTFAFNFIGFLGLILCFFGARYFFLKICQNNFLVDVSSIIFTLALGRTVHIQGHWHMSLASTFGVWMAGLLVRLRDIDHQQSAQRHAFATGICWGLSVIAQPYALFQNIPLFILAIRRKGFLKYFAIIVLLMLLSSSSFLFLNQLASSYLHTKGPSLAEVAVFQSSPLSYVGWGNYTNWKALRELTRSWRAILPEQNSQNWGILIIFLTFAGFVFAVKEKTYLRIILLLVVVIILSFGPLYRLRVNLPALEYINDQIWQIGAQLKPSLFDAASVELKAESVPLPSMVAYLLIPRYEYARTVGRFSIWVGLAALALCLFMLKRLPARPALVIGLIWLAELLPKPLSSHLAPTQAHPAHQWAARQLANQPDRGVWSLSGIESVYSQSLAGDLPSTSTFGSFMPSYVQYLYPWGGFEHKAYNPLEEALINPAHVAILRRAQAGILLLRPKAAALAKQNSSLRFIRCFEPTKVENYLNTPLCAFEVLPSDNDFFNIQPIYGFSYFEKPGFDFVWIEGTRAQAGWRTSRTITHTIELALRAYCPSGQQSIEIRLNEKPIAAHTWIENCWQPWKTTLNVHPGYLNIGWNRLDFEAASAAQPSLHEPNSQDQRSLSVGVELLRVIPAQPTQTSRLNERP